MFKIPKWMSKTATNESSLDKNKEAFQIGLLIAELITSYWNSQKNPGKAYIFNRRVHHGEIGSLLGLSNLFKKSQPVPTGLLSGLGEGLAKDDYNDRKEWFTFKKRTR
ncbi:MAG TPA: hypothetical protein VEL11_07025 [Candidatus Bathyarchaeia archaeon]|nr:hypothetical protein [Candidatus Bathyarchaeia archaeon]